MESTERAIVRLTEDHTEMTEAGPVEWPPLLDWLDRAVTEQVKRGSAGSGGTGSPIDMGALALLQSIEFDVKRLRKDLYLPHMRGLKGTIRETWDSAQALRAQGQVDDAQWETVCDYPPTWVSKIEAEWDDRTRRMEVTVPCPQCGHRWILEEDASDKKAPLKRRSAVWVEYSEGRAPIAECRVAGCETIWVGWADVAKLGYALGASQDGEVLAACGIDLRGLLAT